MFLGILVTATISNSTPVSATSFEDIKENAVTLSTRHGEYRVKTTAALNCRSSMSTKSKIVGVFPKGTILNGSFFSKKVGGIYWMQVSGIDNRGKRITGYVDSRYLKGAWLGAVKKTEKVICT
ncbi:SH3 domain-containing protein [Enterococcus faecalis]|uniref:SH3 domain-containing protein n=1 Tax=Enterococcus faecalis TaxID=1351 RepID=UPI0001B2B94D|nr:SH3 domain-containing protein [Enterococcus faecalis]EEU66530.1 predicted protein [Enterococcus faecalis DS5]